MGSLFGIFGLLCITCVHDEATYLKGWLVPFIISSAPVTVVLALVASSVVSASNYFFSWGPAVNVNIQPYHGKHGSKAVYFFVANAGSNPIATKPLPLARNKGRGRESADRIPLAS